ncbi:imidazole glycerol phosphate synthase subunit HisH [Alphaproteobacteria bacterium]|jgi:glutamine amidotransferase|nr:imidazole glycerol phosphate synthase subunit HisH [Alphaproteobacteria bacterium]
MTVAIIDYGSGNLHSAAKAFERQASEKVLVTASPEEILAADRIVLPGVGAFEDCKKGLAGVDGLIGSLECAVIEKGKPFLGICVGMQLMATIGLEHGEHDGFGWIAGTVKPICLSDKTLKIPHMGWNNLSLRAPHPVLENLPPDPDVYFVHSFHFQPDNMADLIAVTEYDGNVTAAVGRDNMIGTQFHPEKSQQVGLAVISNFLNWRP